MHIRTILSRKKMQHRTWSLYSCRGGGWSPICALSPSQGNLKLPFRQTTYEHLFKRRSVLKCSLQLSCMSVCCGRKVERLEDSYSDTRRTCKPHAESISCLGTELFIWCGCDHFYVGCGFYSCKRAWSRGFITLIMPGGGWKRWAAAYALSASWTTGCYNNAGAKWRKGLF